MSQGVLVTEKNFAGQHPYDSRNVRPQIALNHDPPHHDILVATGTAIQTNAGNGFLARETFLSIKHGLGFRPKVLVYFLNKATGQYYLGTYIYGAGAAIDSIIYEVNETNFSIIHQFDDTFAKLGFTSTAPDSGPIQIKYSIFSIPVDNYTDPAKR